MPEELSIHQLKLPVHPYVRNYILSRYNSSIWTPISGDRIGKYFLALLERVPNRYEKYSLSYTHSLPITLLNDYVARRGCHISRESIVDFNEYVRLEILEEIMTYLMNLKNNIGVKKYRRVYMRETSSSKPKVVKMDHIIIHQLFEKKEVIYDCLRKYNISEDEFAYESIKKAMYKLHVPLLSA